MVQFINYPPKHSQGKTSSPNLNEVINHTNGWRHYMVNGSLPSSLHETCHKISSDLRNGSSMKTGMGELEDLEPDFFHDAKGMIQPKPNRLKMGGAKNGFYTFKDRAVIFSEPKIVKSKAAEFIPTELRGSRFRTYITGQTAWEGEPLYIFDEWNAYINGMEVLKEKIYPEYQNMDFTCGPVEFMMYGMGLVLAIKKYDPEYFEREPNFLPFVQFQVDRSLQAADLQKDYPWDKTKFYLNKWPTCKDYLAVLNTQPDNDRDNFNMV